MLRLLALLLISLFASALPAQAATKEIIGVASVIDGDTMEIHGVRIRFFGIDAPESRQQCRHRDGTSWRCGQQAALALQDHIGRKPIACTEHNIDRYRRVVAWCRLGSEDLNGWLVEQGWAVAYPVFSRQYLPQERTARATGAGVWSGEFVMPWEWRRGPS